MKYKARRPAPARDDREIIAPFFAFCSVVVGYFAAEALLGLLAHPFHWLTAALVGVLTYVLVLLMFSYRARHR